MKLFHYNIDAGDAVAVFTALHDRAGSLWFDSADRAHSLARYSFIAYDPFETIESREGRTRVVCAEGTYIFTTDPFMVLQERIEKYGLDVRDDPHLPPFQCGAAGYFAYDLARDLERLPVNAAPHPTMPAMMVGLYDKVCAFDHEQKKSWFMTWAPHEAAAQHKFKEFQELIARAPAHPQFTQQETPQWQARDNAEAYRAKVQRVIDYIYAGDIFQANLSQQFHAPTPPGFDAFAHYCRLRSVNPAPFAAYMNWGAVKISSASPERFLHVRGQNVETRPIKGTRPRRADPDADAAMCAELAASEKDHAENAMIVDLLRNDLSKVCADHSIEVPQLCAVESFAAVHHLVSVVTGQLRADKDAVDLLRACFPGGSITGAPKVRAMEIIEELEPVRRGPYCGSLAYIGFNGAMDSNIVIRTIIHDGDEMTLNVGGGIVADSEPAAEYQETLDKGRAVFRSFEVAEQDIPHKVAAP